MVFQILSNSDNKNFLLSNEFFKEKYDGQLDLFVLK